MNKIHKLFFILTVGILFASCAKDDSPTYEPTRDYAVQYAADIADLDKYIDTHYITVVEHPGFSDDKDVVITEIPTGGAQLSIRLQTQYPIQSKTVTKDNVDYKVYYLSLREGVDEKPTSVDSVYVSYKGSFINGTQFDSAPNSTWFKLEEVVSGWAEIIPLFKTGKYDVSGAEENPATYTDFGAGVMFLPSGLGYYNNPEKPATIPAYSPLIFSFKLNKLRYRDQDRDKILSKDEVDPNVINQNPLDYDSDGDGYANMYDSDDDNDYYLTKNEIKKPTPFLGTSLYYPFNLILDNPLTTGVDESEPKGIPDASGDGVSSGRLRRHLDPNSHPPFTTY